MNDFNRADNEKILWPDIADLRCMTGDNRAVVELSTSIKGNLAKILEYGKGFSREELMKLVLSNYSWVDYWNYQWAKSVWWWSTPEINTIYGDFLEKYPDLSQFSLDIWSISHLEELIWFLNWVSIKSDKFMDVRREFKEEMGDKVLWRWMMLTDDELWNIEKNWIISPLINYIHSVDNKKEEFEAKMLSTYTNRIIESHFHWENYFSPFISVSWEKNIAIAVWRHFWKKNDDRKFYLFKIKLPEIDRIFYTEHWVRKPQMLKENIPDLLISVNEEVSEHNWNRETESFIPWKIDINEIIDISNPNVTKSSWNNRKTVWLL